MFEKKYKQMYDQVKPGDALLESTVNAAMANATNAQKPQRRSNFTALRKPVIAIACIGICLSLATPALAATVEPVYQLMYRLSPAAAQYFMPVQRSAEDNGIQMEVISAYIHENVAEIYISMQDLTGDRIDETTDLFDSYSINRPFDSVAHCAFVAYAPDTKTATFLVTIEEWGKNNIVGDKITFSVREFLSRKKTYENVPVAIALSTVSVAEHTQPVSSNGGGGIDYDNYVDFERDVTALSPTEPRKELAIDGIDLTGVGYIDGKLHIQTAVKNPLNNDNHGEIYLKDSQGNRVTCNYNFYFSNQYDGYDDPGRIDYCNYVFDIPLDEISQYTVWGDFVISGLRIEGDWRVTFPLEAKGESR